MTEENKPSRNTVGSSDKSSHDEISKVPHKPFKLPSGIYPQAQEHTGPTKPLFATNNKRLSKKLSIIILFLVIAAAIVWKFVFYHSSGIKLQPPASAFIINNAEMKCENDVGDKYFCQFVARFNPLHTPFTETSDTSPANGYTTTSILDSDGNNNASFVQLHNGQEVLAATSYQGNFYLKDDNDPFWTKYNAGSSEIFGGGDIAHNAVQSVSQIIDPQDVTGNGQISYRLVDKEHCGKLTCLKYQINVQHLVSSTHYIWFDSRYFLLRREYIHGSSYWNDNRFEYGDINISIPGPIKP